MNAQSNNNDDLAWMELLAGRDVDDADPHTRREADLIRQAVLAKRSEPVATEEPAVFVSRTELEHGWQRLQFRMNQEGLVPAKKPLWQHPATITALAATLAVVFLVPTVMLPPDNNTIPGIRKGDNAIVLTVAQPQQRAQALAAELTALGLDVKTSEREGQQQLDVSFTGAPPAGLRAILDRYQIDRPITQQMTIIFSE